MPRSRAQFPEQSFLATASRAPACPRRALGWLAVFVEKPPEIMSARSVAASCKPPMLVTRAQLPARASAYASRQLPVLSFYFAVTYILPTKRKRKVSVIRGSYSSRRRQRGDLNPCGQSPMDFKSITFTTRSDCLQSTAPSGARRARTRVRGNQV